MTRLFRDRFDVTLFAFYCLFMAFLVFGACMGWWHVRR